MRQLANHINKTSTLNADQINRQSAIIRKNIALIGQTSSMISEALELAALYENATGPLFMTKATRRGFPRKPAGGFELDRAIFAVLSRAFDRRHLALWVPEILSWVADLGKQPRS